MTGRRDARAGRMSARPTLCKSLSPRPRGGAFPELPHTPLPTELEP
jgi:hypothetical protein